MLVGQRAHLVHVDQAGLGDDVIGDGLVELAGEVELHAVRQVAAVGEVETEDRVADRRDGVQRGGVGRGARVRLDVGVVRVEQLLEPVDRDRLDLVDELAAAVVALAGVALGVLVGQHAALCLQRGDRREVLRGDHLERRLLAVQLGIEQRRDVRVELGEMLVVAHAAKGTTWPSARSQGQ